MRSLRTEFGLGATCCAPTVRARGAALVAAVSVWALSAGPAYAQGCAMCREAAASQKAGAIAALNSGILILGAPVAAALFVFSRLLRRYAQR